MDRAEGTGWSRLASQQPRIDFERDLVGVIAAPPRIEVTGDLIGDILSMVDQIVPAEE